MSLILISGDNARVKSAKERLLMVSAFFGRTNITENLFQALFQTYARQSVEQPSWMRIFMNPARPGELDTGILRECIAEMGRLCLLQSYQVDSHGVTWQFHPVVQDWAQHRQGLEMRETLAMEALFILNTSLWEYGSFANPASQYSPHSHQRLRPHVDACYANCREMLLRDRSLTVPWIADAAQKMVDFFLMDGRHDLSMVLQENIAKDVPAGSPEEKWARLYIAMILIVKNKLAEAAQIQEKLVDSQIPGQEDIFDAALLMKLAWTYQKQVWLPQQFPDTERKKADCEAVAERALKILNRLPGEPSVGGSTVYLGLALLHYESKHYEVTMGHQEKVLNVRTRLLGNTHVMTLEVKDKLALTYGKLGRFDRAAEIRADIRAIWGETLGKNHPGTLRAERMLTWAWRMGGHTEKARALNEDILQRTLGAFGRDHCETKEAATGLWRCLIYQDLVSEADGIQEAYGLKLLDWQVDFRQKALLKDR
ncbi:tetratricopeptide repeat protein [Candidatus Bathyarchaeota archaeon]|nr:tetratricopeptide repeat protein [Candidatus Bathyarchaeota archaeon]